MQENGNTGVEVVTAAGAKKCIPNTDNLERTQPQHPNMPTQGNSTTTLGANVPFFANDITSLAWKGGHQRGSYFVGTYMP